MQTRSLLLKPGHVIAFLLGIFLIVPVQAAQQESGLLQCRAIQSLSERLRCYDNFVDNLSKTPVQEKEVSTERMSVKDSASESKPVQVDEKLTPEELFGKSSEAVQKTVRKKLEIDTVNEISSKVVRLQKTARDEYIVYLENGQVWKQKSKAGTWRIKEGETAVISSAALGSYLMRASERNQSVRAERLR